MAVLKPAAILYRAQQMVAKMRPILDGLDADDQTEILTHAVQTLDARFQIVEPGEEEEGDDEDGDIRESLHAAFSKGAKAITAGDFKRSFKTIVEKGDPQGLRLLALFAGIDLTDTPKTQPGEGAQLLIIRPHPNELTIEQEADVVHQIAAAVSAPMLPPAPH